MLRQACKLKVYESAVQLAIIELQNAADVYVYIYIYRTKGGVNVFHVQSSVHHTLLSRLSIFFSLGMPETQLLLRCPLGFHLEESTKIKRAKTRKKKQWTEFSFLQNSALHQCVGATAQGI